MDVEYSFFLNSPGEDTRSLLAILRFLAYARWQLGPRLRLFTLLLLQPIRIYPHTRLAELARAEGLLPEGHDLIEGRYWNPGHLQHAAQVRHIAVRALDVAACALQRLLPRPSDLGQHQMAGVAFDFIVRKGHARL
jgi:hypothetical protein